MSFSQYALLRFKCHETKFIGLPTTFEGSWSAIIELHATS